MTRLTSNSARSSRVASCAGVDAGASLPEVRAGRVDHPLPNRFPEPSVAGAAPAHAGPHVLHRANRTPVRRA